MASISYLEPVVRPHVILQYPQAQWEEYNVHIMKTALNAVESHDSWADPLGEWVRKSGRAVRSSPMAFR